MSSSTSDLVAFLTEAGDRPLLTYPSQPAGTSSSAAQLLRHWTSYNAKDVSETAAHFTVARDPNIVLPAGEARVYRIAFRYYPSYARRRGSEIVKYRVVPPGEDAALEEAWATRAQRRVQEKKDRRAAITVPEDMIVSAWKCPSCETIFEEEPEVDPYYSCDNCGNEFSRSESEYDSHRCGSCGKFAAKEYATSCPDCLEGIDEFEEVETIEVDGALREVGELEPEELSAAVTAYEEEV